MPFKRVTAAAFLISISLGCGGENLKLEKDAYITALTIKKAVIAFKTKTGKWPGNLQELVPTYVQKEEALVDPWGKMFQFQTVETEIQQYVYVWTTKNGKPLGDIPK